jgi:hypothetical protein
MATPNDRDTSRNVSTLVVLVADPDDRTEGVEVAVDVDEGAEGVVSGGEDVEHATATSPATKRPARWIFDGKGTPLGERTLAHDARIGGP